MKKKVANYYRASSTDGSKKGGANDESLIDIVFSWTINDIFNQHLYKDKVQRIPETFSSVEQYFNSYCYPLIEETHADLHSSMINLPQAPACNTLAVEEHKDYKPPKNFVYKMVFDKEKDNFYGKEVYTPQGWDVIAFSDVGPARVEDLIRKSYIPALVLEVEEEIKFYKVKILAAKPLVLEQGVHKKVERLFAVFLINITTSLRIWRALNGKNLNIIQEVLHADSLTGVGCLLCSQEAENVLGKDLHEDLHSFNLNESQLDAMLSSIVTSACNHKSSLKLIWGPPGTGKTKTVGTLLWALLKMKCQTLTCAPTNTAVVEVTSRLLRIVRQKLQHRRYGLGDIVLFGNKDRMKIDDHDTLHEVFLDYRSDVLAKCFSPVSGWGILLQSMICLLEESYQQYLMYLENIKSLQEKDVVQDEEIELLEFIRNRFSHIQKDMKLCIKCICTHMPTSSISVKVVENMDRTLDLLRTIRTLLYTGTFTDEELKKIFSNSECVNYAFSDSSTLSLSKSRNECLKILRSLKEFSVPNLADTQSIKFFCLQNACLIFCTASSSAKLYGIKKLKLLVIDEAAQLKECESAIPLQLHDIRHAILIGDERQLPALVKSKISENAEFGRSLFQRLVSLGHKRHLLSIQYRMHPSISLFPNSEFYSKQISDAPNVKEKSYKRDLIQGNMYGPYSFIDVSSGKEESNNKYSRKNMMEVAVISEIVENLSKASAAKGQKVRVGIISPYTAQVIAISEKLGDRYGGLGDFSVSVRTVDGFQGGEEDVIIISTVRSNGNGSVGFLSNHQRTNVALTRARYCLWILGNGQTLISSDSVWRKLVLDAMERGCYFNADEDNRLSKAIIDHIVEHGQLNDLLSVNSLLFKGARWKAIFGDEFLKSLVRIKNVEARKKVVALLMNLLSGWRHPPQKQKYVESMDGTSSQLLQQYKIDGLLNVLWTVDIDKRNSEYIQILRFWDILPSTEIPKLVQHLDIIFGSYTVDNMNRCKFKCLEGTLEVPMSWEIRRDAVGQKYIKETNYAKLSNELASLDLGKELNTTKPGSRVQNSRTKGRWQVRS